MERLDHVKCIQRSHADFAGRSWCGRNITGEWHFMSIDHAVENCASEGRLLSCENCMTEIKKAWGTRAR